MIKVAQYLKNPDTLPRVAPGPCRDQSKTTICSTPLPLQGGNDALWSIRFTQPNRFAGLNGCLGVPRVEGRIARGDFAA